METDDAAIIAELAQQWRQCRFSLRWASRQLPDAGRMRHAELDHHSVWWCARGQVRLVTVAGHLDLAAGEAALMPPHTSHTQDMHREPTTVSGDLLGFGFYLTPDPGTVSPLRRLALPQVWLPQHPLWQAGFEHLASLQPRSPAAICEATGLAMTLAWEAVRAAAHAGTVQQQAAPPWLATARTILGREMRRIPPLAEVAKQLGVGEQHLIRVFRATHGCTPAAWNRRRRLDHAARILIDLPYLEIREVAQRCGYRNLQAFTRAFHRQHGMAPRDWRRVRG